MTLLFAVGLAAALLEDDDLRATMVIDDRGFHRGAFDEGQADRDIIAVADCQHVVEGDDAARLGVVEFLDVKFVASLDAVLLAAGLENCMHDGSPEKNLSHSLRRIILGAKSSRRPALKRSVCSQVVSNHALPLNKRVGEQPEGGGTYTSGFGASSYDAGS